METGIVSYGTHIPKHRIDVREIYRVWRNVTPEMFDKMSFSERVVLMPDEDSISIAVNAAQLALDRSGLKREQIGGLFFGSGTNPYATKPAATVVQDALGLRSDIIAYDIQFSGKSGTSAIITAAAFVASGACDYAIAIGADTLNRHFPPGTQMEYSASAGAFACIVGKDNLIAKLEGWSSHCADLADYFRTEGERYIQLGGGWIGYVSAWGLLEHIVPAGQNLFKKLKLTPKDFNHVAIHQANGIQPMMAAGKLGLDMFAVMQGVMTPSLGDTGSAGTLIPLAHILDNAGPDERVLVAAYGSGAGSDCLSFKTTAGIEAKRPKKDLVMEQIDDKLMVDYATASKYENKLVRSPMMLTNYL
ncbi:MAG: hydroxymethylglutaryl-CoA synthase [Candidatus Brocadiia bacterium]